MAKKEIDLTYKVLHYLSKKEILLNWTLSTLKKEHRKKLRCSFFFSINERKKAFVKFGCKLFNALKISLRNSVVKKRCRQTYAPKMGSYNLKKVVKSFKDMITLKQVFRIFVYINYEPQNPKTQMEKETERVGKTVRMLLTESELLELTITAETQQRSLSNMVSIIVSEYIANNKRKETKIDKDAFFNENKIIPKK